MQKLIIALIFCVFALSGKIRAAVKENDEGETSHTQQISSDSDLESIESLAEIKRDEILPLHIFTNLPGYQYQNRYQLPQKLVKLEVKNGKIARGTEFLPRLPGIETFLCPKENSVEKCLVRTSFKKSEPLRCSSEPTPQWLNMNYPCAEGDMGSGTLFLSVYEICETEDYYHNPKYVNVYEICYNTQLNKVIYTSNTIMSSGLLDLKLLARERRIDYPIIISDDSIFSNHSITNDIVTGKFSKNPQYQLQQLVSHGDMAFAALRKTAYNNLNYEWMHGKLIKLWNDICANIRSVAKEYSTSEDTKFAVNTAIIDINPTSEDDDQLCNIWMKMPFVVRVNPQQSAPLFTHGMVILMNNFLYEDGCSNDEEKAIEQYCFENVCTEELTNEFTRIGGQIRCCPFTPEILNTFNFEMDVEEELHIPNVTVAQNRETFHFYDAVTWDQARELLREVQPNEILPLILLFPDYHNGITLSSPKNFNKIEIKNKRIVEGSEFRLPLSGNQFFFCPKEDNDDKCLYIKKFGRFQPLQCAKEAIPVIQKINEETGKCGYNDKGTLHDVGYEICLTETHDFKFLLRFYEFCYDADKKRNVFTHHSIVSPKLLFENLLSRERDMQQFTMTTDNLVPISPPQKVVSKPGYILQQLVPSEDMAFASLKKTTYQRINADWQHEKLVPLWNTINGHIRDCVHSFVSFLQKKYSMQGNINSEFTPEVASHIHTGIFYISYESEESADDQIYNIWVKVIRIEAQVTNQVVILMNNFLLSDQNTSTSSSSKQNAIRKYCKESLCLDSLTKDFEKIGGQIRCCPLTRKIANLFGWKEIDKNAGVLSIAHIN